MFNITPGLQGSPSNFEIASNSKSEPRPKGRGIDLEVNYPALKDWVFFNLDKSPLDEKIEEIVIDISLGSSEKPPLPPRLTGQKDQWKEFFEQKKESFPPVQISDPFLDQIPEKEGNYLRFCLLPKELRDNIIIHMSGSSKKERAACRALMEKFWVVEDSTPHIVLDNKVKIDAEKFTAWAINGQKIRVSDLQIDFNVSIDLIKIILPHLDWVNLSSADWAELSPYCKNVKHLGLDCWRQEIIDSMCNMTQLESLELSSSNYGQFDYKNIKKLTSLRSFNLNIKNLRDEDLKHIAKLKNLTSLNLSGCDPLSGSGLKYLKQLPLKTLDLSHTKIEEFQHCNTLKTVTKLILDSTGIKDRDFVHFHGMTSLQELSLSGCHYITGRCFQNLLLIPNIYSLSMSKCRRLTSIEIPDLKKPTTLKCLDLSGYGRWDIANGAFFYVNGSLNLKGIQNLKDLEYLNLSANVGINDSDCAIIGQLKQLNTLSLSGSLQITNEGLKEIGKLRALTRLYLSGCFREDNPDPKILLKLPHLEVLDVSNTTFFEKDVNDLRKSIPQVIGNGGKTSTVELEKIWHYVR